METNINNKRNNIVFILNTFLKNWLLFLVFFLLSIAIAIFYLKISAKTYIATAKILIKTDAPGRTQSSNDYINVPDLMYQDKDLNNEITYLASSPLIKDVVEEMDLRVSYYVQEDKIPIPKEFTFSLSNIYKSSPFIVVINEDHPQPLNTYFYISITNDETFNINSAESETTLYTYGDNEVNNTNSFFRIAGTYSFGEIITNGKCSFQILLNSNYDPDYFIGKDLFFKFNSTDDIVASFQKSLSIETSSFGSSIADLVFESENPNLSAEFLQNLINTYIEKNLETKNFMANNTIEYIDRQLDNISSTLGRSEQRLQNFRSNYEVMNIDTKSSNVSNQIEALQEERNLIQTRYRNLSQINNYFEQNRESDTFFAPPLFGQEDQVLNNLIQELAQLSSEKQTLLSNNQTKSPRLKTLTQNIGNLKKVVSENLQLKLKAASDDLQSIEQRLAELNAEFERLPQEQRQLVGLERDFNITDAAYSALLDKRIQAQIAKASNQPDCEIIEPVNYAEIGSPNPIMILLVSIVLGLIIPSIYVLFRFILTDRITNKDDLEQFSNLPIIGSIPHSDKGHKNVVQNYPVIMISEAFHSIKSNLIYYLLGERNKSILVTSSVPNEGKSFVSLNLATSLAVTHNKTLLLSFDLRKRNEIFKNLGDIDQPGISSYLINQSNIDEIIQQTKIPNLDFIGSGTIPPNPVALISNNKTTEFIKDLKSKYDYIVIDTPPYDAVTDAFLLMNQTDITLFVSRIGVIRKKSLINCMHDIQAKKLENIYLLMNDLKHMKTSYYAYGDTKQNKKSLKFLSGKKKKNQIKS